MNGVSFEPEMKYREYVMIDKSGDETVEHERESATSSGE